MWFTACEGFEIIETSKLGYDSIKALSTKVHQEIEKFIAGSQEAALKAIDMEKESILIMCYSFNFFSASIISFSISSNKSGLSSSIFTESLP